MCDSNSILENYNRLRMGLKFSPNIAQQATGDIFNELEDTDIYINDIDAFSKNSTKWLD